MASLSMGRAVRGALAEAGLTHAEAAARIGISLASLSRRINGDLPFTWPELVSISDATSVPVSSLIANAERIASEKAA